MNGDQAHIVNHSHYYHKLLCGVLHFIMVSSYKIQISLNWSNSKTRQATFQCIIFF